MNETVKTVMENLKKNNMEAYYVAAKEDVVPLLETMLHEGDTVAVGGSVTLEETGVLQHLRCGKYLFLDRHAPGLNREQVDEIFRRSFGTDAYLTSSNAVTMDGELYNVDGRANRISAIAYGPRSVIVVAGINKIVPDLAAAVKRVKTVAAPLNAQRLHMTTPCCSTGHCLKVDGGMTDGCSSPDRICASYLVSGRQMNQGRIKVILVGKECGY